MNRRLASPSPRAITLFKPEAETVREDKHLSQVVANYYDFDDTIYDLTKGEIPASIIERLDVLHATLGIKAHIITARNHEMDHKPHHYMRRNCSETKIIFVNGGNEKSVPELVKKHRLHEIIALSNIIYCDFYHKVPADHPEYSYYFDYCDENKKTSKVSDFFASANTHGYKPAQTAVYDDNISVWPAIEEHTKNFFHVNNKSRSGNLESHLNKQILQLILYGTHLTLTNRVWAANIAEAYFSVGSKEFSAIKRFAEENKQIGLADAPSLDISF